MVKRDLFNLARAIDIYCQTTPEADRNQWPARWSVTLIKNQAAIRDFLKDVLEFARQVPESRTKFDLEHSKVIQQFVDRDDKGQPVYVQEGQGRLPSFKEHQAEYDAAFKGLLEQFPTAQQDITNHNAAVEERMGAEVPPQMVSALVLKVKLDSLGDLKINDQWARLLEPMIEV